MYMCIYVCTFVCFRTASCDLVCMGEPYRLTGIQPIDLRTYRHTDIGARGHTDIWSLILSRFIVGLHTRTRFITCPTRRDATSHV